MNTLLVAPSPHQKHPMSTQRIMLCVLVSLLPAVIAAGIYFGLRAILLILTCVTASVAIEGWCRILMKRPQTISDLSAAVTGLILALNLPVTIPIWQALIGCFVAIAVVKQLFGGLGQNFANPAIVGRIVLMLSFTGNMTTWAIPRYWKEAGADVVTGATPLVTESASYRDLFLGNTGGCIGETCAIGLILGGLYLIFRGIISPSTPIAYLGSFALLTFIAGNDVPYQLMAGGLLLGAFFMATDYVTTPITCKGKIVFGIGCGVLTFLIRQFGGYPEGVSFSILLMNILTPYIDRFTAEKPIGAVYESKKKEEKTNA
ncbi:MAG: RnfABCDGE type electron transport complex subunit D [Ruminococcus sp.]|nr:RnfABCDGE type electron transport complex subunit D [Ruminococcus sp.]